MCILICLLILLLNLSLGLTLHRQHFGFKEASLTKGVPPKACFVLFLGKRKMQGGHGKGGARHFAKPSVDVGILKRELDKHKVLLQNLGAYESVSRNQSASPKGLIQVIDLVAGLVALEPSCEIHQASLRSALMSMYTEDPNINNSRYNGSVWIGQRIERLNTILYHFRRLRNADDMRSTAIKLTSSELLRLQKVVEDIDKKEPPAKLPTHSSLGQRDGESQELVTRDESTSSFDKKDVKRLKKEVSEVSMDSEGYPKCFNSPDTKTEQPLSKGDAEEHTKDKHSLPKGDAEEDTKDQQPLSEGEAEKDKPMQPSFMRRKLGQTLPVQRNDETFQDLKRANGSG